MLFLIQLTCFTQETEIETVRIGNQVWMKHNLNTSVFRTGINILTFTNDFELSDLSNKKMPAVGDVIYESEIVEEFGKLYNWYAVKEPAGLCPQGFRVPSYDDFEILLDYISDNLGEGESIEGALSTGGSSGFDAKYAGWCCMNIEFDEGKIIDFANVYHNAAFWTITESEEASGGSAWNLDIGSTWRSDSEGVYFDASSKGNAYSVRCIKE